MAEPNLIRCPACSALNRVPPEQVAAGRLPICGRCKAPLPLSAAPVTVTDATFAADVERSPLPVLLDLWAPWCGPCHMVAPIVEELAKTLAGHVRVAKLNVDENPRTAARFAVRSIPTLLVLKGGQEVDRIVGVPSRGELERRLDAVMG